MWNHLSKNPDLVTVMIWEVLFDATKHFECFLFVHSKAKRLLNPKHISNNIKLNVALSIQKSTYNQNKKSQLNFVDN